MLKRMIAIVDENGIITGVESGEAVIAVTAHNGLSASVTVNVYRPVEALEITMPNQPLYVVPGRNQIQMTALMTPSNATCSVPIWESSDAAIASVDENGLVSAAGIGTVTITATADDPEGVSYSIELTVGTLALEDIELPAIALTYTGEDLSDAILEQIRMETGLRNDIDCTIEIDSCVDAGEYPFTVEGIEPNCTGILQGIAIVEKVDVEVTFVHVETCWVEEFETLANITVVPEVEYVIQYTPVDAGMPVDSPDTNGLYEVSIVIEGTDNIVGKTVSMGETLIYVSDVLFFPDHDLTLTPGQSVRLPEPSAITRSNQPTFSYELTGSSITYNDGIITALSAGESTLRILLDGSDISDTVNIAVCVLDTMSLPVALREIGEEAFMGDASIECVVLGSSAETIGGLAFACMEKLKQIEIPTSVTVIAANAFMDSDPLIICAEGSEAQRFARESGLQYVYAVGD